MANRIRTGNPRGFNKGHSSKFHEGSRVRQTPEEGRGTYRPKRCGNNNKEEDNSPKTLNDKNSSMNFLSLMCFGDETISPNSKKGLTKARNKFFTIHTIYISILVFALLI